MDKKIERIKTILSNLWDFIKFIFIQFGILTILYIIAAVATFPVIESVSLVEYMILTSMAFIIAILIIGSSSSGNL